jgi:protein-S-isoprenylcysteine O-methyltransferase Ste14
VTLQDFLLDYPFFLPLLAAALAQVSAVFLRRASIVFGSVPWNLSLILSACSIGASVWSMVWSWTLGDSAWGSAYILLTILGWLLAVGGVLVTVEAVGVRGLSPLRAWPQAKIETRPPYRWIKRPLEVGLILIALGATLIVHKITGWICFGSWLVGYLLLLELAEWELQARLPEARDYLKRTPRYLPRLVRRNS